MAETWVIFPCTLALASLLLAPTPSSAQSPSQYPIQLKAAYLDLQRQPPILRPYLRYLDLTTMYPEKRIGQWQVVTRHINGLSRSPDVRVPFVVPGTAGSLLRINLQDYAYDKPQLDNLLKTWENLATADPYYHVRLKVTDERFREQASKAAYFDQQNNRHLFYHHSQWKESFDKGQNWQLVADPKSLVWTVPAISPWVTHLDPDAVAYLVEATGSKAPILRADWYVWATGTQEGRNGYGYYDWLGIKDQKTFEALIGFDGRLLKTFPRYLREAVRESGVATNPRRIDAFATIGGWYWETTDVRLAKDRANPLLVLNDEYKTEKVEDTAHESFAHLPNGLFAWGLFNGAGARADSAPDFVGGDKTSHSKDLRIHVGTSCIRCHEGSAGINDFEPYIRGLQFPIQSPDPLVGKSLASLYGRDLGEAIEDSRRIHGRAVKKCHGLETTKSASIYGEYWAMYDSPVTAERAAREVGLTKAVLIERLAAYKQVTGGLDSVLSALLVDKAVPLVVYEDNYLNLQLAVGGYVLPADAVKK